jgi:hypothetical protein
LTRGLIMADVAAVSSDPAVSEAVAELIKSTKANPYSASGKPATIQDIKDVIECAFGRKAAKSVKIAIH